MCVFLLSSRRGQYIDFEKLHSEIIKTSDDAINLAKAYDAVLRLTGVVVDNDINLLQVLFRLCMFYIRVGVVRGFDL